MGFGMIHDEQSHLQIKITTLEKSENLFSLFFGDDVRDSDPT